MSWDVVELICFSVITKYCSYVILLVSQVVDRVAEWLQHPLSSTRS